METQTLANIVLIAAFGFPVVALLISGVLYVRRRKPKDHSGRRSIVVFGVLTMAFGIAFGYIAHLYLPWPLCQTFSDFSDGSWCGVTAYISGPLGFSIGTLIFAVVWSFYGAPPNNALHTDTDHQRG